MTGLNDSENPDASADNSDMLAGGEMCQAAFRGDTKYVTLLLKYGVNPNACDYGARAEAGAELGEGRLGEG